MPAISSSLFVDTSALLCILDKSEHRSGLAVDLFVKASKLYTTNYVLTEFIPLAETRKLDRELSLTFINDFLNVPRLEVFWVNNTVHHEAMQLLSKRLDKAYSLCDAVSFIVMREYQLTDALTTDRHFSQEGFVRLLV